MTHSWLMAMLAPAALAGLAGCQTPGPSANMTQGAGAPVLADPAPPEATPGPRIARASASPTANGEGVYRAACASCHDNPDLTRSPSLASLRTMSYQFVNYTLTRGKMADIGARLGADERAAVVSYVTGRDTGRTPDWTPALMCPETRARVDLGGPDEASVTHFGYDWRNRRSLTAGQAGLTRDQMADMELAWAIAFPDASTMRSQGAVVGHNLFYPVAEAGRMYAFDLSVPDRPCVQWVYTTPGEAPLRTSVAYGVLADGSPLLVFAGIDSTVHALDPRTGEARWTRSVGVYSHSMTTGTPVVLKDRIIVPVSQFEITVAADNSHPCCTNHGYVLSLDPRTGEQQWRYDTMEEATPQRDRGDGKPLMGPSGAPIWNSPVVDESRGLVFFATGEANSPPAHRNTNAIIAVELASGRERWSFQATPNDIYNSGCRAGPSPERLNCVGSGETVYRDVDFGASLILARPDEGPELLFAGQKSGSVWALNPDTGKVVWRTALGTGGALGGVHWGIAFDEGLIYAPVTQIGRPIPGEWEGGGDLRPGLYALDAASGTIRWRFSPEPPAQTGGAAARGPWRGAMLSAAPAVIDGAVVTGALTGALYITDAKTGKLMWSFETARAYDGLNGLPGKGGAIDSNAITAAGGLLLVNSGYAMFGQTGGNVLLAFRPKAG